MPIPTRDEAVQVAELNLEMDAEKYIREIESKLIVWDGKTEICLTFKNASDLFLVSFLVDLLKKKGYEARYTRRPGSATGYNLIFK